MPFGLRRYPAGPHQDANSQGSSWWPNDARLVGYVWRRVTQSSTFVPSTQDPAHSFSFLSSLTKQKNACMPLTVTLKEPSQSFFEYCGVTLSPCFGQCFRISHIEGSVVVAGWAVPQPAVGGVGTLSMATTAATWRRIGKDMRRGTCNDVYCGFTRRTTRPLQKRPPCVLGKHGSELLFKPHEFVTHGTPSQGEAQNQPTNRPHETCHSNLINTKTACRGMSHKCHS